MNAQGESTLSEYWVHKLKKFGFPGMNIDSEDDQNRILDAIRLACTQLPRMTKEERDAYNARGTLAHNVAVESRRGEDMNTLTTMLSKVSGQVESLLKKPSGSGAKKSKSKKKDEDSSDDDDLLYESDNSDWCENASL